MRDRFGPGTQQFYAVVQLFLQLLTGGIWLWGLAIFVSSVIGIPTEALIVALGLVVLLYSTTGGTWAVMATDFVQGLVMLVMAGLLTVLCFHEIGGVAGFFRAIEDSGLSHEMQLVNRELDHTRVDPYQYTAPWAGALLVLMIFHNVSMGSAVKFFSVKTGRDARFAALITGLLMIFAAAVFFIPPITARLLYPEAVDGLESLSKPAEGAYAVASLKLLPESLLGVMLVSMFAATMSSMDTALNRNAAFVVRDIMPAVLHRFDKEVPGPKRQMRIGQGFTILFGLSAIMIALFYTTLGAKGILEVTLDIAGMIGVPVAIPLVLGLFVRKTPGWSALFTVGVALIPSAFGLYDAHQGHPWPFHWKIILGFSWGITAFACTRLAWKRTDPREQQKITAFFKRMRTPIDFEKEVGEANDDVQLRLIGAVVLVVAGFIALLAVVPQTGGERLAVFSVAGILLIIGGAMHGIGWMRERRKRTRHAHES